MRMRKIAIVALLACIAYTDLAQADDSKWSGSGSIGIFSEYMFRGTRLYDGTSIQPSAKLTYNTEGYGSFSGNVWAHISGSNESTISNFTEVDETLSYDLSFDGFTLSLGHIWYTYPDSDDDIHTTNEFFGTVVIDTLLTPTLSVYRDYRVYDNEYYELAISQPVQWSALGDGFGFTPYAAFAFASNADKVYAENGLVQITTGLAFNASLGDISLTPTINYTFESDDNTVNQLWTGVTLGYSF